MMMPFKRQALVEFENVESAKKCVTFAADEPVYIAGQQAFFNYSTSKRITRPGNTDDPSGGNKVLLLSIQNPLYPITVVCFFFSLFNIIIKGRERQSLLHYFHCVLFVKIVNFSLEIKFTYQSFTLSSNMHILEKKKKSFFKMIHLVVQIFCKIFEDFSGQDFEMF